MHNLCCVYFIASYYAVSLHVTQAINVTLNCHLPHVFAPHKSLMYEPPLHVCSVRQDRNYDVKKKRGNCLENAFEASLIGVKCIKSLSPFCTVTDGDL